MVSASPQSVNGQCPAQAGHLRVHPPIMAAGQGALGVLENHARSGGPRERGFGTATPRFFPFGPAFRGRTELAVPPSPRCRIGRDGHSCFENDPGQRGIRVPNTSESGRHPGLTGFDKAGTVWRCDLPDDLNNRTFYFRMLDSSYRLRISGGSYQLKDCDRDPRAPARPEAP